MKINFQQIELKKRFPLAISRGVSTGSTNLFVSITHNNIIGWGEMSPNITEGAATADEAQDALKIFFSPEISKLSIHEINQAGRAQNIPPCALAALDIALWDYLGKKAQLPLYQLLALNKPTTPTSITIGINSPEVVKERIPLLLSGTGIRSLKIKLGSPEGIETDQAMYAQVVESAKPYAVKFRVDANGGWDIDVALRMMKWLADRGTDYIEQPLKEGQESELPILFKNRPLPIFVDESCRHADNIPNWAEYVDGVNLKLMKCGGITEALNIIAVARAHRLQTMIGCMGESSVSISAGAAISGLVDHVDLDSHLNLAPDPCQGARLIEGVVMPNDLSGHGASIIEY